MPPSCLRTLVLCLVCVCSAAAQTTQPTDLAPLITRLVADLRNESWSVRQTAQDRLAELGTAAVPLLEGVLRGTDDEEVRTRVEAALRQIERTRATGQSIITLCGQFAGPGDVFAQIARQASIDIRPNPPDLFQSRNWPAITLDIQGLSFWQAMRQVGDTWNLAPTGIGGSRELLIAERNAAGRVFGDAPYVVSGPFMVVATGVYVNRSIDLNNRQNPQRRGTVHLMVWPEPKIRVLQAGTMAQIEQAIDENGESLAGPPTFTGGSLPQIDWSWNATATLNIPPTPSQRIAVFKGSLRALIQVRGQSAQFDGVMNVRGASRDVAGRKYTLKQVTRNGEQYSVNLVVHRAAGASNELSSANPYSNFKLLDDAGQSLMRVGFSGGAANLDFSEINLQFHKRTSQGQPTGEPARLVWDVPVETREEQIPFEFRDLPMP